MIDHLKGAWRSMTIWFNVLFGAFVVNFDAVRDSLPQIQPYMTSALYNKLMLAAIIVNIALRFKTNQSLVSKARS